MNNLLLLFFVYFRIGLFTIGGGYAMIPLIQQSIVDTYHWISLEEFVDFIAIAESTPGPFAVNTATFVGMKLAGLPGAAVAVLGCVLPSFIIILIIAKWMTNFADNKFVKAGLYGMMPIVIALILSAVFTLFLSNIMQTSLTDFTFANIDYKALATFIICMFLYYKFKINPILLILISAGIGIVLYGLLPMVGI